VLNVTRPLRRSCRVRIIFRPASENLAGVLSRVLRQSDSSSYSKQNHNRTGRPDSLVDEVLHFERQGLDCFEKRDLW
jgi:hypothetical protein